jgi:hypothetical protein
VTEPAQPQEATTHTVILRGASPGAIWEVYPATGSIRELTPLARCGERGCKLRMRSGEYRLWVERVDGSGPKGYRELRVYSDLDLTARAPSGAAKGGGLALAIVGKVGFFTGMVLTTFGAAGVTCECPDEDPLCDCSDPEMVSAGLVTMLFSAIAIPAGWVMFARNRRPHIDSNSAVAANASPVGRLARATSPTSSAVSAPVRLGPLRLGTGYGLGARVSF